MIRLEPRRIEVERPLGHSGASRLHLREDMGNVDSTVSGRERAEPTRRFFELAGRGDGPAAARLVPRDRHVDEPLEEIPLLGRRSAPRRLELLVRLEIAPGANLLQAPLVRSLHCA